MFDAILAKARRMLAPETAIASPLTRQADAHAARVRRQAEAAVERRGTIDPAGLRRAFRYGATRAEQGEYEVVDSISHTYVGETGPSVADRPSADSAARMVVPPDTPYASFSREVEAVLEAFALTSAARRRAVQAYHNLPDDEVGQRLEALEPAYLLTRRKTALLKATMVGLEGRDAARRGRVPSAVRTPAQSYPGVEAKWTGEAAQPFPLRRRSLKLPTREVDVERWRGHVKTTMADATKLRTEYESISREVANQGRLPGDASWAPDFSTYSTVGDKSRMPASGEGVRPADVYAAADRAPPPTLGDLSVRFSGDLGYASPAAVSRDPISPYEAGMTVPRELSAGEKARNIRKNMDAKLMERQRQLEAQRKYLSNGG